MKTPRQSLCRRRQSGTNAATIAPLGRTAERTMAWLVLLTIAMSILGSVAGHAEDAGKEKNGVRRAASQLERKTVKIDPVIHAGQVKISQI